MKLSFALASILALSAGIARADVVYSNPYNGSANGNCLYNTTCGSILTGNTYAAQQFTLASGATIGAASFTSLVDGTTGTGVNYAFYTSTAGLPETQIASGTASLTPVSDGSDPSRSNYTDYTYNFAVTPVTLGSGTYYFAIQEITSNFYDYLGEGVATGGSAESDDGGVIWTAPYATFLPSVAVSLYGTTASVTPEPAAIYLLGSGLGGIAALRRRFVHK